jgi:hypothetical protein
MKQRYKEIQIKTVHTLLLSLLVLAACYVLVLLSLVFSVVERKQNMLAIKEASSNVSSLENEYASYVASISDITLQESMYKKIDTTTFTVRKDEIASYTVLYAR